MRVLLVHHSVPVLDAIATALRMHWPDATVDTGSTADAAFTHFLAHPPDALILDLQLPGRGAFNLIPRVRQLSAVPIMLVNVATDDEAGAIRGLEMGADAYLTEPLSLLLLLARVRAVLRRTEFPSTQRELPELRVGEVRVNFRQQQVLVREQVVPLTSVEYKLVYYLVRNLGRVVPQQALLDWIWGPEAGAGTIHLKVFVSRLRAKLRVASPDEAYIQTVRATGYRWLHPGDHSDY